MTAVDPIDEEDGVDRRASSRVPFQAILGVTENTGSMPDAATFRPVQALDLSHTGVRFNTSHWPTSDSLMLMLGDRQKPTFAAARVVGCAARTTYEGERCFAVRCEFEKWITPQA